MKKRHLITGAAAALAVVSAAPPAGADAGDNILGNPGFEGALSPWSIATNGGSAALALSTADSVTGDSSLSFTAGDAGDSFTQGHQPINDSTTGATYSFGFWARTATATETAEMDVTVWFWDDVNDGTPAGFWRDIGTPNAPDPAAPETVTDQWQWFSYTGDLRGPTGSDDPTDDLDHAHPEIYLQTPGVEVLIDDMILIDGTFTKPNAPGSVTVDSTTDGSLTLSWPASTVDWDSGEAGGSAPSSYTAIAVESGSTAPDAGEVEGDLGTYMNCQSETTGCTIEGLDADTSYDVYVAGANIIGLGEFAMTTGSTREAEEEPDELAPLRQLESERTAAGLEITDQHSIIARFYWIVLGRAPEYGGAKFWFDTYDGGEWSTRRIATHFATSPEFVASFGRDLPDDEFVELVYTNGLGRASDATGAEFWQGQLAGGMPRPEMVLLVSNDTEFKSAHPLPWES